MLYSVECLFKFADDCSVIRYFYSTHVDMLLIFFTAAPRLNVPPRFRDTAFFDKGENVVVKIPFTGSPKPRITWQKDGETVESGGHFAVQVKVRIFVFGLFY